MINMNNLQKQTSEFIIHRGICLTNEPQYYLNQLTILNAQFRRNLLLLLQTLTGRQPRFLYKLGNRFRLKSLSSAKMFNLFKKAIACKQKHRTTLNVSLQADLFLIPIQQLIFDFDFTQFRRVLSKEKDVIYLSKNQTRKNNAFIQIYELHGQQVVSIHYSCSYYYFKIFGLLE